MQVELIKTSPSTKAAQTLVLFAIQTPAKSAKSGAKPSVAAFGADKATNDWLQDAVNEGAFRGDFKECLFFRHANLSGYKNVLFCGLGTSKNLNHEILRQGTAQAWHTLNSEKTKSAHMFLENITKGFRDGPSALQAATEGLLLCDYDYDDYKAAETKKDRCHSLQKVQILAGAKQFTASYKGAFNTANVLVECVNLTRRLGDSPGNIITPEALANEAEKAAKGTKLKVTSWNKARIKKEKMGGLYGVSAGSDKEPRFIILEYKGAAASKKPIAFVGKGLTFDSGGISIKPSSSMDEMRYDMCGGGSVIGAMLAIAKLGLKVNAVGYVPASENMPGPNANKPGDILVARNGKSVEVLNTDAEGRLILMDALSYATEQKPQMIVDAATLTGAIVVALGNLHTAYFTRDKKLAAKIEKAAEASGELMWPMPIADQHLSDMKGVHADLSNISSFKGAGSSTAAAFLEQFVDKDIPWAHFDIAGTAWNVSNRLNYCQKKAASGVLVRTFVELAKQFT